MKRKTISLVIVTILTLSLQTFGGSLEPSAGPGSTMKTLDEVEARIPIKPSEMPKTISSSGSYYLTGNFTAGSAGTGINVDADNVTIDLNGYTLDGNGVGGDAIQVEAGIKDTTIRNGYIKNWSGGGINAEESERAFVEKVHVDTVGNEGIFLSSASIVVECSANNCDTGIEAGPGSIIKRCSARNNTSAGFTISNNNCIVTECVASGNGNDGLDKMKTLTQIEPRISIPASSLATGVFTISSSGSYYLQGDRLCSGTGIQVNADNVTIDLMGYSLVGPDSGINYGVSMNARKNVEVHNGTVRDFYYGIYEDLLSGQGHRIIDVRIVSNVYSGIYLAGNGHQVKDCTVFENGTSIFGVVYCIRAGDGSTVTGNTVYGNGEFATSTVFGIAAGLGCTVTGNTVCKNGTSVVASVYGITANSGSMVTGNTVHDNGRPGIMDVYGMYIFGNSYVDGNVAYGNGNINMWTHSSCTVGTNHAP